MYSLASIHQVQPYWNDTVHTVWLNGPAHSGKLSNFPSFGTGPSVAGTACSTKNDQYTGYSSTGQYCEFASDELDRNAHLLVYSGNIGIVVDAAGLAPSVASGKRNIFPKCGYSSSFKALSTPREIYDALPSSTPAVSLTTSCSDGSSTTWVLGTTASKFMQVGLVRQGHTVTQLSLTALTWHDANTGTAIKAAGPACNQVVMPSSPNCNGAANFPCSNPLYPECKGFVQGSSWGKCYTACTGGQSLPNLWSELTVWGDSIAFDVAWDMPYNITSFTTSPAKCTASITASLAIGSDPPITRTTSALGSGRVSILLNYQDDGKVGSVDPNEKKQYPISVKSTDGAAQVRSRAQAGDVFIEVPKATPVCGYSLTCAKVPLTLVPIEISNPHPTKTQTVRLVFSRNFNSRDGTVLGSNVGSEITGMNLQLWDTATKQATGIPVQISKNWHSGATAAYWAGFSGSWWTGNVLLHLPPSSLLSLSLAINYELYGNVPSFSHAQLSIVGYSDKWLWEEAALGSGGENMCFDPIGAHTRSMITDVRPKLFDGNWKENTGGGDFLLLFGASGAMQYLKQLDPIIHASGPCLSNASYTALTADGSMSSSVQISGGRTNDFVRIFMKIRLDALKDFAFSRLAFFQTGSETYNYRPLYDEYVVGSGGTGERTFIPKTCSGDTSRASNKLYSGGPFRVAMNGTAPWYIAFNNNRDPVLMTSASKMVVGDRGIVIRSFKAKLGGVEQKSPTFSVLCDKVELGTPKGLLNLAKGDFVDMSLEFLVLPRVGSEYDYAKGNIVSKTLEALTGKTTWERVEAQAINGILTVSSMYGSLVESNYPIRVCADASSNDNNVGFTVKGSPLGFVPVVICGLTSPLVPDGGNHGLWVCSSDGSNCNLLKQGSGNEFWQTNYNRASGTYEIVYNVELSNTDSFIAFGTTPSSWPTCSSPEFTGRAGACSCADGYIGSVVYVHGAPSGCNLPNVAPTSRAPTTTTTSTTMLLCAAGSYKLNGGCAPCPVGSYCQPGALAPTRCADGKTSVSGMAAATDCTDCAAGTWVSDGSGVCTAIACAGGYFCLNGARTVCPNQRWVTAGTGVSAASCTTANCGTNYVCTGGMKYCKTGFYGAVGAASCTQCPAGFYCIINFTVPTPCAAGTYSNAGASSSRNCLACPSSKYSPPGSASCAFTATTCPKGTYGVAPAKCLLCPAGTYSGIVGAKSQAECLPCPKCLEGAASLIASDDTNTATVSASPSSAFIGGMVGLGVALIIVAIVAAFILVRKRAFSVARV